MRARRTTLAMIAATLLSAAALPAAAQSFRVQCPDVSGKADPNKPVMPTINTGGTLLHPVDSTGTAQNANGQIKCQQVFGTDGYATMADGTQIYIFGFGPGSGMDLVNQGLPGTQPAADFNQAFNAKFLQDGIQPDPSYQASLPVNTNAGITDPTAMMNWGVLAAQQPAPLIAIDEDDELFMTLTNVGQIMRPDLFEQHTIHFHGYPQASSYFDGVPDASVAINIAGSMTYYYTAPEAGTYFWHCHITPPEHLQMGMVGQLYVRPRQNNTSAGANLFAALRDWQALDPTLASKTHATIPTRCFDGKAASPDGNTANLNGGNIVDVTCATPMPAADNQATHVAGNKYAYNDGDGSTRYDVEYPIQLMGFDPTFHYVGMTFNPEDFSGMKDKYFMLSGRSYPDTVMSGPETTLGVDGMNRPTQPQPTAIHINRSGGQTRALLRLSMLSVTEFSTLGTIGVPMTVIGWNARQLRDMAGNNLYYNTNSITFGGGESADAILDVSDAAYSGCTSTSPCTFFLYSTNLDHLSNDAENFGGAMTEIVVD